MNDTKLIQEARNRATKTLKELEQVKQLPQSEKFSSLVEERLMEKDMEKDAPSTGYPELDQLVRGFLPGHLYTLTGDTNVGKTSIACNFAVRVAKQGKNVLYFALEPGNMIVDYIASVYHRKKYEDLEVKDYEIPMDEINIYKKDAIDTIDTLVNVVETLDRYDLIVIDHIGYFVSSENNYIQQQSNVIKKLALLAKRRKCAIMLIAHLRKGNTKRKDFFITPDDISGSAAFKQDSTEVFILTRMPKSDEKDEVAYSQFGRFYVHKTKSGSNGVFGINFLEKSALIFTDAEAIRKAAVREQYEIN